MTTTEAYELSLERSYRYTERLGILCGSNEPTEEQKQLAAKEADEAVRWKCTVCGRIGSVGRCCGLETRVPLPEGPK